MSEDDRERVVFDEAYDGMPDKLEMLVGDAGFIVQPSRQFTSDDRVVVQFDENKTGREGGERHWIPERCLQPETDDEGDLVPDGGQPVDGVDRTRVVSLERSDVYHRPNKSWSASRCGSIGISEDKLETGVVELEPRRSAEEKQLQPCDRCFDTPTEPDGGTVEGGTEQMPEYWSVKVYDEDGRERETIRALNVARKTTLMQIFDREGVQAQAMGFDADGEKMVDSESVNWGPHELRTPTDPEGGDR